jgi:hypothetical protein
MARLHPQKRVAAGLRCASIIVGFHHCGHIFVLYDRPGAAPASAQFGLRPGRQVFFEVPFRMNPLKRNSPGRRCASEGLITEVILKQFYSVLVFSTFRHSRPTGFPIFIGTSLTGEHHIPDFHRDRLLPTQKLTLHLR